MAGSAASLAESAAGPTLTLRLLDPDGNPLAGAVVGTGAYGDNRHTPRWKFYDPNAESDDVGAATLKLRNAKQVVLLYARHEAKGLAAFHEVDAAQFGEPIEIKLQPACRVFGTLKSSELEALKRPVAWTNVYLFVDKHRSLSCMGTSREFEFFVPPGHYRLWGYGELLGDRQLEIDVRPEQKSLDVGALDLPAEKLATLLDSTAPELENIKGWMNTGPLTLAALRGKVVILDFWGHWCGPCVHWMPHLVALHDAYHDRGLVVIGIHDNSVADLDEMNEKLEPIVKGRWSGRRIPFALALDGGEKSRGNHGTTTSAYGIRAFPTALLIDREGKLVSEIHASDPKSIARLRELLGIAADEKAPFVSTWRKRFDAAYRLAPGQNVKRVAPPFLPEREPFLTYLTMYGGSRPVTERLTVVENGPDESLTGNAGDARLGSILRSLVPFGMPDGAYECPSELAKQEVPGDWVFREASSLEERFDALTKILREELDLELVIERRKVERDAIVVSGAYEFHPLAGAPPEAGISFTADPADHTSEVGGGGPGSFADFGGWLARTLKVHVVDETTGTTAEKIRWHQRESAIHNWRRDTPPKLDKVLELLQQQTSLKFEKAKRDVDVWFVRKR
jgi:thiol-disulfide isomerase/thioredoxin